MPLRQERVWFSGSGFVETPVYAREALARLALQFGAREHEVAESIYLPSRPTVARAMHEPERIRRHRLHHRHAPVLRDLAAPWQPGPVEGRGEGAVRGCSAFGSILT